MRWLNEPAVWALHDDTLTVSADPDTDFWRTTHYGYIRDTGHLFGETVAGDGEVTARVRGSFVDQFDQAGVMARVDDEHWVKAGVELFAARLRLSSVVTTRHSSWAYTDLPIDTHEIWLRLRRVADAVEVSHSRDGDRFTTTALAYLPPRVAAILGVMCAAPEGTGFSVTFHDVRIAAR